MDNGVFSYLHLLLDENSFGIDEADAVGHQLPIFMMLQIFICCCQFTPGIDTKKFLAACAGKDINPTSHADGYFDDIGKIYLALLVVASYLFQGIEKKWDLSTVNTGIDLPDFFLDHCSIFLFNDFQEAALPVTHNSAIICGGIQCCCHEGQGRQTCSMGCEHSPEGLCFDQWDITTEDKHRAAGAGQFLLGAENRVACAELFRLGDAACLIAGNQFGYFFSLVPYNYIGVVHVESFDRIQDMEKHGLEQDLMQHLGFV